jgi:hypothetical protein
MTIFNCPHCGKPIDRQAAQFQRHKYPELVAQGLGHLWVGPGFNDFAEPLIRGTQKFLRKHDLPAEKGDAINAARSKIYQGQWGYLEQRFEEGMPSPPAPLPGGRGEPTQPPTMPQAERWVPIWELNDGQPDPTD